MSTENKANLKENSIYSRIKEVTSFRTDVELAEAVGVTPQAVTGWKKNDKVAVATLKVISALSGASVDWLLTGQGEKFPSNSSARTEQTVGSKREGVNRIVPVASVVPTVSLPVVGELMNNRLQQPTQERSMSLPQTIVSETTLVIEVTDESLASEGLHKGDALIVEEINGQNCEGKVVVAEWSEGVIIRRLIGNNGFARFPASAPCQHEFSIPCGDIKLRYIVKIVLHAQA